MGRNRKTGLDYFPFDVDTFQDIKIRKLIKYQSGKAVTVYALLLCFIYKDGYYMRWDKELPFIISEQTGFEEAYIQEVIKSCMVLGLFSKELFEKEQILTSKGIQYRYRDICKQIKRKCDFSEYSLISSEENDISSEEIPVSSEEKPINSEKSTQSKGKKSKEKGSNIPPAIPPCGDADADKSWRDDFEIYKSELKEAFEKILADRDFIENRQKYHPNLDIELSLQKSYEDYWSKEAGWKKKKSSKTREIDWPATFRKALDQPQNRVYKQNGISKPEPEQAMSELQEKFAKYLKEHAPMLLQMPLQPTDEEIKALKGAMRIEILLDLIKKINNDKYLTTRKNSVFQTIMELKQKEYGTT